MMGGEFRRTAEYKCPLPRCLSQKQMNCMSCNSLLPPCLLLHLCSISVSSSHSFPFRHAICCHVTTTIAEYGTQRTGNLHNINFKPESQILMGTSTIFAHTHGATFPRKEIPRGEKRENTINENLVMWLWGRGSLGSNRPTDQHSPPVALPESCMSQT